MTKLILFASVLLLAYGVNAWSLWYSVENTAKTIVTAIDDIVEALKDKASEALQNGTEYLEKVVSEASDILNKFKNTIEATNAAIDREIELQVLGLDINYDKHTCLELRTNLNASNTAVSEDVETCLSTALEKGKAYLAEEEEVVEEWIEKLTTYSTEAKECVNNITGMVSALKAVACVEVVYIAAVAHNTVESIKTLASLAAININIAGVSAELVACDATAVASEYDDKAAAVLQDIITCLTEAVDAAISML